MIPELCIEAANQLLKSSVEQFSVNPQNKGMIKKRYGSKNGKWLCGS